MARPNPRVVAEAVRARIGSEIPWDLFEGAVDRAPTQIEDDPEGRVKPYVVFNPSPGAPSGDYDLGDQLVDGVFLYEVRCVAGFLADLGQLVHDVDAALERWSPTIGGLEIDGLRVPIGYDPGPYKVDDQVDPPRFWTPLLYTHTVTS